MVVLRVLAELKRERKKKATLAVIPSFSFRGDTPTTYSNIKPEYLSLKRRYQEMWTKKRSCSLPPSYQNTSHLLSSRHSARRTHIFLSISLVTAHSNRSPAEISICAAIHPSPSPGLAQARRYSSPSPV